MYAAALVRQKQHQTLTRCQGCGHPADLSSTVSRPRPLMLARNGESAALLAGARLASSSGPGGERAGFCVQLR